MTTAYDLPRTIDDFPKTCGICKEPNILLPNGFRVCYTCDCLGSNYRRPRKP